MIYRKTPLIKEMRKGPKEEEKQGKRKEIVTNLFNSGKNNNKIHNNENHIVMRGAKQPPSYTVESA